MASPFINISNLNENVSDCKQEERSTTMHTKQGKFIAFEGIDGSGKSTQIELLTARLRQAGIHYYTTMEPTDSPIGSLIRQILTGRIKTDYRVIAPLFAADRLDHLLNETDGVLKKIEEGTAVIMDRYYFSSYAYQGVDMSMEDVMQINAQSRALLKPTATVFIDIDPDVALERIARNRAHKELFEKRSRLVRVRENYFEAFRKTDEEETILIVDGNQSLDIAFRQ